MPGSIPVHSVTLPLVPPRRGCRGRCGWRGRIDSETAGCVPPGTGRSRPPPNGCPLAGAGNLDRGVPWRCGRKRGWRSRSRPAIPAGSPTGCLAPTVPDQSHPPPAAPTRHAGAVLPPWPAGSLGGRGAGCARWVESTGQPAQRGYGVLPWFSPHNLATSYDGMSCGMQRFPKCKRPTRRKKGTSAKTLVPLIG